MCRPSRPARLDIRAECAECGSLNAHSCRMCVSDRTFGRDICAKRGRPPGLPGVDIRAECAECGPQSAHSCRMCVIHPPKRRAVCAKCAPARPANPNIRVVDSANGHEICAKCALSSRQRAHLRQMCVGDATRRAATARAEPRWSRGAEPAPRARWSAVRRRGPAGAPAGGRALSRPATPHPEPPP